MKILTLDIEMTPNLAHLWQLWGNQHVSLNQLIESSELLCAAWKWHGETYPEFTRGPNFTRYHTVDKLWIAVDEADAIVTYNGRKFDMPRLNSAFIENGFDVPSPYTQIDLYQTVKRVFGWPSNKLDYVAQKLLGVGKATHEGHDLWVKCMSGDADAWARMEEYNKQDVVITELLYDKLKPWIPGHPNTLLYGDEPGVTACPRCGSRSFQKRGFSVRATRKYQQYKCNECAGWFSDTRSAEGTTVRA